MDRLAGVWTVREFDEAYTAPFFGFAGATDYYHRASAMRVVDRITVPALIITAEDDPFVPTDPFRDPPSPRIPTSPWSSRSTAATADSLARRQATSDGYWAEEQDRRVRAAFLPRLSVNSKLQTPNSKTQIPCAQIMFRPTSNFEFEV